MLGTLKFPTKMQFLVHLRIYIGENTIIVSSYNFTYIKIYLRIYIGKNHLIVSSNNFTYIGFGFFSKIP